MTRRRLDQGMSERDFQTLVVNLARTYKWEVSHQYDSRRTRSGMPDLELWQPGVYMKRELKTDDGVLSPAQVKTIEGLKAAGVDVDVWRPADWERIVRELSAPRRRRIRTSNAAVLSVPVGSSEIVPPPSSIRDELRPAGEGSLGL